MEKRVEKEVDLADTSRSDGEAVRRGVPLSCAQCEHFAWTKARMKMHVDTAHGTPKVRSERLQGDTAGLGFWLGLYT